MSTKSGQLYYKGQAISSKTLAKDITVEDLTNIFTASDLENVLIELHASNDVSTKVDKIDGMGLSQENYTTEEKDKLAGIEENANNYVLPSTLPATIIAQDVNNRFVSDDQINTWNAAASGSSIQGLLDSNLATAEAYTDTSINTLKGAVPTTLNTLTKIAASINNDPNFYMTITNSISSQLDSFSGRGAINIETEDDLDGLTIVVGDIVNMITTTVTFYQVTDETASTFATRFTVVGTQDKANCTQATDETEAMSLSVSNGDYIYIITYVINNSYECVDASAILFNDKFRVLYKDGDIDAKINALIDGAPGTLNTLNELASALNDDANFATNVTNQLTALNTSITTVSNNLSSFQTTTNNSISTINTTLVNLQNQITSLQNTDVAAIDGGTF